MSKNEQKLQTDDEFGVLTAEEIKLMKRGFWGETRSPPVSLRQLTQEACGFFFLFGDITQTQNVKKIFACE